MKKYCFAIDRHQAEWMFAPIRSRRDAISVLMKTLKVILVNSPPSAGQVVGEVILQVSKMSRIFFISEAKVFSLAFPFFITETDGVFSFKSHSHSDINHKATSDILSVLDTSSLFDSSYVFNFAEPIDDLCQSDEQIWALFRELLTSEEGYIRYDYDELHQNGHFHPVNHFDVFFSTNVTFKIGLTNKIDHEHMVDMLDSTTHCHYIAPPGK